MDIKSLNNSNFQKENIKKRLMTNNDTVYFNSLIPNKSPEELTNDLTNLTIVSILPPPLNIVGNILNAIYL